MTHGSQDPYLTQLSAPGLGDRSANLACDNRDGVAYPVGASAAAVGESGVDSYGGVVPWSGGRVYGVPTLLLSANADPLFGSVLVDGASVWQLENPF